MRKIFFTVIMLAVFLIASCIQQPTTPIKPITSVEEPVAEEPEQICTERWVCQDENTKLYRKSDCTLEQRMHCEAGCENGACKEVIEEELEEPKPEETKEEEEKETKEKCTIGFKCLDENRRGYQSSNCMFDQVDECKYGCKDGECIETPPPEEKKEETFSLIEGKDILNKTGWKYSDFSKQQVFEDVAFDYDFRIKLYASASSYDYFRVESTRDNLWVINNEIGKAMRSDCIGKISEANSYSYLRTGQTLCIETREKDIALVGGYWEGLPEEDTELTWKYYS